MKNIWSAVRLSTGGVLIIKCGVSFLFYNVTTAEFMLTLYIVEFVVDDIREIIWNPSSFDNLAIPPATKQVITAMTEAHVSQASDDEFDDFVVGKGQGLIILLQY